MGEKQNVHLRKIVKTYIIRIFIKSNFKKRRELGCLPPLHRRPENALRDKIPVWGTEERRIHCKRDPSQRERNFWRVHSAFMPQPGMPASLVGAGETKERSHSTGKRIREAGGRCIFSWDEPHEWEPEQTKKGKQRREEKSPGIVSVKEQRRRRWRERPVSDEDSCLGGMKFSVPGHTT